MRVVGKRKHVEGDRAGLDELVLRFGGGTRAATYRDVLEGARLPSEERVSDARAIRKVRARET